MKRNYALVRKHAAPQSWILSGSGPPTQESTAELGKTGRGTLTRLAEREGEKAGVSKAFGGMESWIAIYYSLILYQNYRALAGGELRTKKR